MGVLRAKVGGSWVEIPGVGAGAADVPWIAPTLQGTWVNFDATTYSPAGYRRIGDIVYYRGLLKLGAAGSLIFTLPVGYRPPRTVHCATVANDLVGVVRTGPDGQAVFTTGSVAGWVSIDNVQFSVTL